MTFLCGRVLVERYAKKAGKEFTKITKKTWNCFRPMLGRNIRGVGRLVERAVVLSDGDTFWVDESWLERKQPPNRRDQVCWKRALTVDADREGNNRSGPI